MGEDAVDGEVDAEILRDMATDTDLYDDDEDTVDDDYPPSPESGEDRIGSQWSVLPVASSLREGQDPTDGSEYLLMVRRQAAGIPSILMSERMNGDGNGKEGVLDVPNSASGASPFEKSPNLPESANSDRRPSDAWQETVFKKLVALRTLYASASPAKPARGQQKLLHLATRRQWDHFFAQVTNDGSSVPESTEQIASVPIEEHPQPVPAMSSVFPEPVTISGHDQQPGVSATTKSTMPGPSASLLKHLRKPHHLSLIFYLTKRLALLHETLISPTSISSKADCLDQAQVCMTWVLSVLLFTDSLGHLHAEDVSCLRDHGRVLKKYIASFESDGVSNVDLECLVRIGATAIGRIWGQMDLFEV